MTFAGLIQGDRLSRGEVDVIVCDGFSGNIALKTAEGTARFVADLLKRAFRSSVRSRSAFSFRDPRPNCSAITSTPTITMARFSSGSTAWS